MLDGAAHAPGVTPAPPRTPDTSGLPPAAQLEALVRADLAAELALHPIFGTYLGEHANDDKLDDVRTEAQLREASRMRQLLEQLRALPEDELPRAGRLDRLILMRRTEAALYEASELRPLERNPIYYVDLAQTGIDSLVADVRFDDPVQGGPARATDMMRALTGRLWRVRGLFDDARRNLRASAPELSVRRAIEDAQALRAFLNETFPRLVQAVPDARLADDARAAAADAGRAIDELVSWLQRDFLPRARGELALGPARFWERLRLGEAMPGTLEALVPRVEAALRDATRRADEAQRQVLVGASAAPGARVDPQKLVDDDHWKAEEIFTKTQQLEDQLGAWGRERSLLPIPPLGLPRVHEMPPQLFGFIRLVASPPLEKRPHDPALYIEPAPRGAGERARAEYLRALNRPTLALTLCHQSLGHFLVGLARRQAPSLMQRVSSSILLDEGFAHYVERIAVDEGPFLSDAKVRYVVERAAQLRLMRLYATIRFHAQGAKLDDIQRLFSDELDLDEYQARREAERVALDSLAGAEALGRMEIERLRADWHLANPGAAPGVFHAALLAHGGAPIELIREELLGAPP